MADLGFARLRHHRVLRKCELARSHNGDIPAPDDLVPRLPRNVTGPSGYHNLALSVLLASLPGGGGRTRHRTEPLSTAWSVQSRITLPPCRRHHGNVRLELHHVFHHFDYCGDAPRPRSDED